MALSIAGIRSRASRDGGSFGSERIRLFVVSLPLGVSSAALLNSSPKYVPEYPRPDDSTFERAQNPALLNIAQQALESLRNTSAPASAEKFARSHPPTPDYLKVQPFRRRSKTRFNALSPANWSEAVEPPHKPLYPTRRSLASLQAAFALGRSRSYSLRRTRRRIPYRCR